MFRDTIENIFVHQDYKFAYISSVDCYYYNSQYKDTFIRARLPDERDVLSSCELTLKQKINPDIVSRTEVNIPLDKNDYDQKSIDHFLHHLGFLFQFSLYKKCWIYYLTDMEIVLYDISQDQIHYKRFLEIETKTPDSLILDTKEIQKLLQNLSIDSKTDRLDSSQFEMFFRSKDQS
jgi:adenylate cyclase class IV